MKLSNHTKPWLKIVAGLALLLLVGVPFNANAEDYMLETDPAAPCGELNLIGKQSYISNQSNFTVNVRFKTNADTSGRYSINAGAVKYWERDSRGRGVWRDTGVGDYRSSKTYTVPVKSHEVATIVYCASKIGKFSHITGTVSFSADASEALHKILDRDVAFKGSTELKKHDSLYTEQDVTFDDQAQKLGIQVNVNPFGARSNGSLIICPDEAACPAL